MKYTFLCLLALLPSLAGAAVPTDLVCEIKDRSMRYREDYYIQPGGEAWGVLSTEASDFEGKFTKTCASQSLEVRRSENTLAFSGTILCGMHGKQDHLRLINLTTMEIKGLYADSARCHWVNP